MKRLLAVYPALRISLAGFCAGVLALLALILLVVLALVLFNLVFTTVGELAEARAAGRELPMSWEAVGAALGGSLYNLGRTLWDAWLGLLAAGVLGLLAAWGHQLGHSIDPRWGWPASALALALVVTFSTTAWVFAQWAQMAEWLAQSPELYYTRELFAGSAGVDLVVGVLLGLLAAAPLWMLWQQGYQRLTSAWLPASAAAPIQPEPAASDYRRYAVRLHELKRGESAGPPASLAGGPEAAHLRVSWGILAAGLMMLLLLAAGSTWLMQNAYRRVAVRLEHQTLYLRAANRPEARLSLHLEADVRELNIANIDGAGSVRIVLTGGPNCSDTIRPPEQWTFARRQDEYLHSVLPLAGLPPGDYCLEMRQEEGWGMYEYTLSHGGGRISHQLALATGLLAATTVVIAVGLALLFLIQVGVIRPAV